MRARAAKTHQTIYLPPEIAEELTSEAARQDRSISWLLQVAWKIARERIKTARAA